MLLTTFPRFTELAFELKSKIWEYAIALHIQDIPDRLPPWFENSWVEGQQREALADSPEETKPALRVRILDPYDGLKLRFEEDDFETFVDCFCISAVCHEARAGVARFCQPLVPHIWCNYNTLPLWSLKPPKNDAQPVVIRNLHCQPQAQTLRYFFPQPTTLTMEMRWFKSAEQFVEIVFRFFGNRIQRLILLQIVNSVDQFDRAYWANSSIMREDKSIKVVLKRYAEGDPTLMCITKDKEVYVSESFWGIGGRLPMGLAPHLLKIYEIFNVLLERLPYLEHIDVNLEVRGWESQYSKIAMTYKRDVGVLTVTSSDPVEWPLRFMHLSSDVCSPSPSASP